MLSASSSMPYRLTSRRVRSSIRRRVTLGWSWSLTDFCASTSRPAEGRQITVRYARDGDVLGTPAVIGGPVRTPVQAITDARVLLLNATLARRLAETNGSLAWAFAKETTRRLYDLLDELAGTAFTSVRARVARHLLDLSVPHPETGTWVVTATQQDIADAVGSVREVVARVLKELRDQRLVEVAARTTTILDPSALHRAAST